MPIKMKELMALSEESKSTILYYVKEGLLPEPSKPKPNVHLYDDTCVQILKFIKYLQHNFSYSISEIKHIFDSNHFDFDDSFEMMVRSLEVISGGRDNLWYSKETFLKLLSIDEVTLQSYQDKGYLFERSKGYSSKELEIAEILGRVGDLGLDCCLLDTYVSYAKDLAKSENEVGSALLKNNEESHNTRYKLLFDLVLTMKPYIFNMHTVEAHKAHNNKGNKHEKSL
ncbi:Transcriptional regulator, MerR family [hydrothermal vent metagenome]|uniref:Transcriptional regulator, MerR family n=1 Tax=hydrothermal vent metagenome TaxID=652676 RepID=A0A1W1CIP5_9ZZZZ